MGKHFVMSRCFNKQTPCDFGLTEVSGEAYAINPADGSKWLPCRLYDLGWGRENGYFRIPLPDCESLLRMIMESDDDDDIYGSAAIILEKYPDELLRFCEGLFDEPANTRELRKVAKAFQLHLCLNRSQTDGKTYEEIQNDFNRWKAISEKAQQLKDPLKRWLWWKRK